MLDIFNMTRYTRSVFWVSQSEVQLQGFVANMARVCSMLSHMKSASAQASLSNPLCFPGSKISAMITEACVCISEHSSEDAQTSSIGIHPAIIRAVLYLTLEAICTKRQAQGSRFEV